VRVTTDNQIVSHNAIYHSISLTCFSGLGAVSDLYKTTMAKILDDASREPRIFCWFGAIPQREIRDWLCRSRVSLPSDLLELWRVTGEAMF